MVLAERVGALMREMKLGEKCAQLGAVSAVSLLSDARSPSEALAARFPLGIGHVTRVCGGTALGPAPAAEFTNAIQRFAVEETRLGIPVLAHEESVGGLLARGATAFPQALGLASSW